MWFAQSVVCLIDQENKKRSTDEKVTEREENESNCPGCVKEWTVRGEDAEGKTQEDKDSVCQVSVWLKDLVVAEFCVPL